MLWHLAITIAAVVNLSGLVQGQGLTFELNGDVYAGNAEIGMTLIGEGDSALLCRTDRTGCCGSGPGETRQGEWFYPDKAIVRTAGSGDDFYRNRGTGIVKLNRRNGATQPTGSYCCEVATLANPNATDRICVTLITPLTVTLSGSGGAQIAGEDYTLTCQVTGGGTIAYRWFKDSSILTDEISDTLSFFPLMGTESGDYTCEGTRSSTSSIVTSITSVTISVDPVVVTLSGSGGTLIAGEDHTLTCQVTGGGTMTPTYRWFRNGSPLTGQTSDTLSFSPLRGTDSGVYTCEGTRSSITRTSASVTITVVEVTLTGSGGVQIAGEGYTLTCQVTGGGTMTPTYRWFKNDSPLTGQTSDTLSFSALRGTDSGNYTCEGTRSSITRTSASVTITVVGPVVVTLSGSGGAQIAGEDYTLTCQVTGGGTMTPTYQWFRNGSPLSGETSPTLSFSPLRETNSGDYTCEGTRSSITRTSASMSITVVVPALSAVITANGTSDEGQSYSLTCAVRGDESLAVSNRIFQWDRVGGSVVISLSPILTFNTLLYADAGEYRCTSTITSPYLTETRTVTETASVTVNQNPPGPVSNLRVTTPTATTLPITWTASGFIDRFEVTYSYTVNRCSAPQGAPRTDTITDGSMRSHTLINLNEDSRYTITVRAINTVGSTMDTITADTSSSAPSGIPGPLSFSDVNLTSITVQWTELPCSDRNGEITGYTVEYISTKPFHTNTVTVSGSSTSRLVVGGLLPRTSYTFSVRAVGAAPSRSGTMFTATPTEVGFFLNGRLLSNNSEVLLSDIGEGSSALFCLTDRTLCCSLPRGGEGGGMWRFPDGSEVIGQEAVDISVNRSFSSVLLHIKSSAMGPTGVYTCLIPDAENINRTLYIGVYDGGSVAPRSLSSVSDASITSSGATIQWMLVDPYVPISPETFTVEYGEDQANLDQRTPGIAANPASQTYSTQLNSLEPGTQYFYRIESRNQFGMIYTSVMNFTTVDGSSSEVTSLVASAPNDTTLVLSWERPANPNGVILNYSVIIINLKDGTTVRQEMLTVDMTSISTTNLVPGVPYNVSIAAVNRAGPGEFSANVRFSEQLAPSISPKNVTITRPFPAVMVVSWIPLSYSEARGFISHYTVTYSPLTSGRKRQAPATMTKEVPGMDTNTTRIEDLVPESGYSVVVSATTGGGMSAETTPVVSRFEGGGGSGVIGIAVGIIVALVLVAALIIIVLILVIRARRKGGKFAPADKETVHYMSSRKPAAKKPLSPMKSKEVNGKETLKEEKQDEQCYENTVFMVKDRFKAVSVEEFSEHVQRMHADRDKWFELEYTAIEKSPQSDYDVAQNPENRARNRFANIFPYDFNRVVLKTLPNEEHSDYINASYVDGYKRKQVYIGSQGPTENSVEDFWRMIWEQRIRTVVMLTRIFEGRKKCEAYWPENAEEPFVPAPGSPLTIKYKTVLPFAEFVIRKMVATHSAEPDSPPLEVTLFHYLAWPDHGVPSNAISMVNFVKRVRKAHPYDKQDLLLVHCSAGVGRTGTFITLDAMLERIKVESSINIHEFVSNLRKQRVLMVQTPTQYVFIHNALDELITCGETEIAAANMRIVMGKLGRIVPKQQITGYQRQFEILGRVTSDIPNTDTSNATSEPNTPKNRYQDKIPYNHSRVRLRPTATQGSDYINASFIDGYRQKGAYIATQGPLPHTVNDFWRMVWEQEVKCIVMLCRREEKQTAICHQYWPMGRGSSETYGKYTVTLTKQDVCGDYAIRKMEITESQSRMSVSSSGFSITQFQYTKWPEDRAPQSTTGVLEVANLVQKVQMSSGNKAIVVMCNDGVGRTGAFISTHAEMERMKAETVVDLFQFVKAARVQRSGLVANKEQYEFCLQVLADFLDGFETYANFKEII